MKVKTQITAMTLLAGMILALPSCAQNAPIETRPANAPDQTPQFSNQTRAPQPAKSTTVSLELAASDLPQLWALEFLPDGRMLVSAKAGALHIVGMDGTVGPEITGVPQVDAAGQGGLLDVALAPDFATSGTIFFSYAEPRDGGNGTSVASARLVLEENGGGRLENLSVIFRQTPTHAGQAHYGSRLAFGPKGELYVTVGERSDSAVRQQAQDLSSGLGKVFRIDPSGAALSSNPFVGQAGALPEIWSYGHRNIQSAAVDGRGRLWTVEHGPRGGDELNRPEPGKNYGWPEVTYGVDYSGAPIGDGITASEATEQPVYYWDPVIAPSGMAFYEGKEFPKWNNAALIGGLAAQALVVLHLKNDKVAFEEHISIGARVRDVKVGTEGVVYVISEDRSGKSKILRLTRAD